MGGERSAEHACGEHARRAANSETNPMHGLRGEMLVAEQPPSITVPEFPPQGMTCPHGVKFWAYPDGARVAALRDLNYPPAKPAQDTP